MPARLRLSMGRGGRALCLAALLLTRPAGAADAPPDRANMPPFSFCGERGQARDVVYVIQCGAGGAEYLSGVNAAIKQSVLELQVTQNFNVLLVSGRQSPGEEQVLVRSYSPELTSGTLDTKVAFLPWIDKQPPAEPGDPGLALRRALAARPQAIVLLSDGRVDAALVEGLIKANEAVGAAFYCFRVQTADVPAAQREALERLASATGGRVRALRPDEIDPGAARPRPASSGPGAAASAPASAASGEERPASRPVREGVVSVFGLGVEAARVVYVLDFSASQLISAADQKRELRRSVTALRPAAFFNVLLAYGGDADQPAQTLALFDEPLPASEENKRKLAAWLERKLPSGKAQVAGTLRRALASKPEAIFFLSDGMFDAEGVVEEIRKANTGRTRIHCLALDDVLISTAAGVPRETEGTRRLAQIAEQNGGKLKIVTGTELDGR